jgi:hypothetical protein
MSSLSSGCVEAASNKAINPLLQRPSSLGYASIAEGNFDNVSPPEGINIVLDLILQPLYLVYRGHCATLVRSENARERFGAVPI